MIDVADIVEAYLKKNGYDGLWNEDGECACLLEDLFPCEAIHVDDCHPGYKVTCPPECGEHEWHVQDKNPANIAAAEANEAENERD